MAFKCQRCFLGFEADQHCLVSIAGQMIARRKLSPQSARRDAYTWKPPSAYDATPNYIINSSMQSGTMHHAREGAGTERQHMVFVVSLRGRHPKCPRPVILSRIHSETRPVAQRIGFS
ncbi:hypothetical protein PAXRUDRAFT_696317 [Paxillus rubicundulus Ve08.2h10]|uniref:Uncharacterized protein n=1 Tax=Paxillus rubicundulus Ve08.2h10 TaxID=930991 RepID=A0A0D0CR48_9AGAM|nr:hypothetical protein PAXRUDRAFT_696317 [Paxillus rubicundulus Ve08.2h10]